MKIISKNLKLYAIILIIILSGCELNDVALKDNVKSITLEEDETIDINEELAAKTYSADNYQSNELDIQNDILDANEKKHLIDILKAYDSVKLQEIYNLPSLYHQNTFHTTYRCLFGDDDDKTPIFKVDASEKEKNHINYMSLTFDCSFINDYTYQILDVLDKYDAKVTFFMTNGFMTNNVDQICEILKRGHEIGNHSATHPDFNHIVDTSVVKEVMIPHNFIQNSIGIDMCLFRFPYGSYSPRTVKILKSLGYYPIQWSFDSLDFRELGVEFLIERFNKNNCLVPGAIILFHNGAKYTVDALPYILDLIEEKNLKCIKVSDLIFRDNFCIIKGKQFEKSYD